MTTKKKVRNRVLGSRVLTTALSLGILAAAGMIGMYSVGKSEQQEKEEQLARQQAEEQRAYEEAKELAELEMEEEQENTMEVEDVSSGEAVAQFEGTTKEAPELESDFVIAEQETIVLSMEEQMALEDVLAEEPNITYTFSPETDDLLWPIAGNIILDYSMDKTVYFTTLDQYKYNPAVLIQGQVGQEVLCGADGKVDRILSNDELGTIVHVDFGDGYEGVYGQLKEIAVEEGSLVQPGVKLGVVSEPTHYFAKEGINVYFQILKDGEPVDPMDLLQ